MHSAFGLVNVEQGISVEQLLGTGLSSGKTNSFLSRENPLGSKCLVNVGFFFCNRWIRNTSI